MVKKVRTVLKSWDPEVFKTVLTFDFDHVLLEIIQTEPEHTNNWEWKIGLILRGWGFFSMDWCTDRQTFAILDWEQFTEIHIAYIQTVYY